MAAPAEQRDLPIALECPARRSDFAGV